MYKRLIVPGIALSFGFAILLISILRTASVRFEFTGPVQDLSNQIQVLGEDDSVEYIFPYPGKVLPDSLLWPAKSLRDRLWLTVNTNDGKEADLYLLFSDKRLIAGQILFLRGDYELGFSTLNKAEKYLEKAINKEIENRNRGMDTTEFLIRINKASLAHYRVLEELKLNSPSDAIPRIVEIQDISIRAYKSSREALLEKNIEPVQNPHNWR